MAQQILSMAILNTAFHLHVLLTVKRSMQLLLILLAEKNIAHPKEKVLS
jgi:hypothetical protein